VEESILVEQAAGALKDGADVVDVDSDANVEAPGFAVGVGLLIHRQ
jgi:hypothetical protein